MKLSREFYIPEGSEKIEFPEAKVVAYLYENRNGKPTMLVFKGKAQKPTKHYHYNTSEKRAESLNSYIEDQVKIEADKKARREAKKAAVHGLSVGDILYESWGYDQTNIEFYQVVEVVSNKTIKIRELKQNQDYSSQYMSGKTVAIKDQFLNDTIYTKRISGAYHDKAYFPGVYHGSLSLWDGKPKYYSTYA